MIKDFVLHVLLVFGGSFMSSCMALTWSHYDIEVDWIKNKQSFGVSLIDKSLDNPNHNSVDGFIALPKKPREWVLEESILFILCPDHSNRLSEVIACDLKTLKIVASIPVGLDPIDLSIKGDLGIVLNTGSPSLTLFNVSTCTFNRTIPLQAHCEHLVMGEKSVYAYRCRNSKAIEVLDLETLAVHKIRHRSILRPTDVISWIVEHQGQAWAFVKNKHIRLDARLVKIDLEVQCLSSQIDLSGGMYTLLMGSKWFVDHAKEGGVEIFVTFFDVKMAVHEGLAYEFRVTNGKVCVNITDIEKDQSIRSFMLECPYGSNRLKFTQTHLEGEVYKHFPLYPTPERLDKMRALNKRRDYARMCIGAFKGQVSQKWGRSQDKFYGLLSTTASHSQQLIYDFLHPAEILYALSQTNDNKYLRSTEWGFFRKELLQKLYLALWMEQKEEAHMLVGLFLDINDPEVKGLYKEFGTSTLYAGLRWIKKKLSESANPRVVEDSFW